MLATRQSQQEAQVKESNTTWFRNEQETGHLPPEDSLCVALKAVSHLCSRGNASQSQCSAKCSHRQNGQHAGPTHRVLVRVGRGWGAGGVRRGHTAAPAPALCMPSLLLSVPAALCPCCAPARLLGALVFGDGAAILQTPARGAAQARRPARCLRGPLVRPACPRRHGGSRHAPSRPGRLGAWHPAAAQVVPE